MSDPQKNKSTDNKDMNPDHKQPVIGLALGSGAARGWAHIGVILGLEEMGIRPKVVAGTSIGALVGAVYVSGQLPAFAEWVQKLTVRNVLGLMDFSFSGGMVKGEKLFGFFNEAHKNPNIEDLEQRFVGVCTEMKTGREIWITRGPILDAARASCALPGVFSPVKYNDRWMLDGGMVNPVPVSACRAMGADVVIAVNLNAQLVGAHISRASRQQAQQEASDEAAAANAAEASGTPVIASGDRGFWQKLSGYFESNDPDNPGMFDVMAASINIMQDRITRSRMAGDPAEITFVPLLEDFALMDFHRAGEAMEEGRNLVRRHELDIKAWANL